MTAFSAGSERASGQAWRELAPNYERARAREDSLDRRVEWPAQRDVIGDVTGLSVLDLGCGNGAKVAELVDDGAAAGVGVDISGNFIEPRPGTELVQGDLSDLGRLPGLEDRRFDRVPFLQSFGYAKDPVHALRSARSMLTEDGFIVLTGTQPIRYARERAEKNGTTLGEEYFTQGTYTYATGWNQNIALTKNTYTMSDLLNTFSAAGLWIDRALEPHLLEETARRYRTSRSG